MLWATNFQQEVSIVMGSRHWTIGVKPMDMNWLIAVQLADELSFPRVSCGLRLTLQPKLLKLWARCPFLVPYPGGHWGLDEHWLLLMHNLSPTEIMEKCPLPKITFHTKGNKLKIKFHAKGNNVQISPIKHDSYDS